MNFCCSTMASQIMNRCVIHDYECTHNVIQPHKNNELGISIEGMSPYYRVSYCPWCGIKIKKSMVKEARALRKEEMADEPIV